MPVVVVPVSRWPRWRDNFEQRHGAAAWTVADGALRGEADDGSWCAVRPPFDRSFPTGPVPVEAAVADAAVPPDAWGVLLVRRGGFAVARLTGRDMTGSKTGQRHVQGRTKAGGQSQQRFARRRANQARAAFDAAADHAARLLGDLPSGSPLVVGGDREAVDAVLDDARLRGLRVVEPWLAVPDPRRAVLEQAVEDAGSLRVEVENAPG